MKERANGDIRRRAKESRVALWEVAERYGTSETSFCRMLRHELPAAEKQRILDVIEELRLEANNE